MVLFILPFYRNQPTTILSMQLAVLTIQRSGFGFCFDRTGWAATKGSPRSFLMKKHILQYHRFLLLIFFSKKSITNIEVSANTGISEKRASESGSASLKEFISSWFLANVTPFPLGGPGVPSAETNCNRGADHGTHHAGRRSQSQLRVSDKPCHGLHRIKNNHELTIVSCHNTVIM